MNGSEDSPDGVAATPAEGTLPARRFGLFLTVFALGYALDQITKIVAVRRLSDGERVPLVGDFFQLHLIRNPGAAFGTGEGFTWVFSCLAIVACVVATAYAVRTRDPVWAVALGFLVAGVGGNLTDRMLRAPGPFHGHVVDFFELPHWPIFNVADICIDIAAVLIVVQAFRGIAHTGERMTREAEEPESEESQA